MVSSMVSSIVSGIIGIIRSIKLALLNLLPYLSIVFLVISVNIFAISSTNLRIYFEDGVPKFLEGINIQEQLTQIFSDVPEKTLRIVNVVGIVKESSSKKINEFVRDLQGTYVNFKGSYYYTSKRAKYSYDREKKTYILDPYGLYVYLSDYPWARQEEDKYVVSDFYKRYERIVSESRYFLSLYVVDIDLEKFFVKSATPVSSVGSTFKESLENAAKSYKANINVYNPDKFDVVAIFDKSFNKLQRIYILSKLQEDTRYNIYDRAYIQDLFEVISIEDILGKGIQISFRPPKYVFLFENYNENAQRVSSDSYYYFSNPVSGQYTRKNIRAIETKFLEQVPVKLEIGKYYKYDSEKKRYVLDMKEGQYVKYYKTPWEEEEYIKLENPYAYNFYDVVQAKVESVVFYNDFLLKVIDTEKGLVIVSNSFTYFTQKPLKEPIDRFGSERTDYEYLIKSDSYERSASAVMSFLKALFQLTTVISQTDGMSIKIPSGKNIGIKPGYVFLGIYDGFTTGYAKISNVYDTKAEGYAIYLIPSEYFKENNILFETRSYPLNSGITLRGYVNKFGLGMELGFTGFDVYGNYSFGVLAGLKVGYSEDYPNDYYFKIYNQLTEKLDVFASFGIAMPSTEDQEYNIANRSMLASFGIRVSSHERKSVFSFGGVGFYGEFEFRMLTNSVSNETVLTPNLSVGIEFRY